MTDPGDSLGIEFTCTRTPLGLVLLLLATGCSASAATPFTDGDPTAPGGSPAPNGSAGSGFGQQGQGGEGAPGGSISAGSGASNPDDACQAVVQQAEQQQGGRADIIWIVDNSGSMSEENAAVQSNLNAFSNFISESGIDVRVVLVSAALEGDDGGNDSDWGGNGWNDGENGICVEPPLGSGSCPDDTNLPTYLHVNQEVGSHDALGVAMDTYGDWRAMLRPDATKTFVVVTDDEWNSSDDGNAIPSSEEFLDFFGMQPEFRDALLRFSGIYCFASGQECEARGATYQSLVDATGGVAADLALQDFGPVFDQLADAVVADAVPVDCEWTIPAPPDGQTLDPNAVNVRFTAGSGEQTLLFGLENRDACRPGEGGWYYDDPVAPERVIACPSTCDVMQADDQGRVEVLFGCRREQPPPR